MEALRKVKGRKTAKVDGTIVELIKCCSENIIEDEG